MTKSSFKRALFVAVVLATAAVFQAGSGAGAASVPFQRGATVGEWGATAYNPSQTKAALKRLRKLNADTVTLFIVYMQRDGSANTIGKGSETARDRNLLKAIRAAKAAGLRVILRPYIDRDDGGWRGDIHPSDLNRWFASYSSFITKYARLAAAEKVSGFVVGSEMVSLSSQSDRWRALVGTVRGAFKGFVTYQANWDEAESVTWWDTVDVISISAYFPLSNVADPTTAELIGGWSNYTGPYAPGGANWLAKIDSLRQRFAKNVFFGEIGYRPTTFTSNRPWDVTNFGMRSETAQTRPYEAALQVWYTVPWFRGFEWWLAPPKRTLVAPSGNVHGPLPATLKILKRYYARKR